MKILQLNRKKKFAGALLPYWIIIKISKAEFLEMTQKSHDVSDQTVEDGYSFIDYNSFGVPIKNGKTIEVEIADNINSFFVTNGVGGISDEIIIDVNDVEFSYQIDTKGGFKNASFPYVYKV